MGSWCGANLAVSGPRGVLLMHILAAVSSRFFRQVLTRYLSFLPTPPEFVESISGVRQRMAVRAPDLLLMERFLADGNGLNLCEELRRQPGLERLPVVLLTANDEEEVMREGLRAGVTEVFNKTALTELVRYVEGLVAEATTGVDLQGRAVLVEDSRPAARFMQGVLERLGLQADVFDSGEGALEALQVLEPDIVLVDVVLAGRMSGLGLVRAIRALGGTRARVPIVAMSGLDDVSRRVELLRQGADDFLAKPLLEEELAARVRNLVRHKRLLDETEAQREHLRKLAMTDRLTGLANRHHLEEIAARWLAEAARRQFPVGMVVMDLDRFKSINDEYGHDMGDTVLVEAGRLLASACGKGDMAAGMGGEEFVVLAMNRTQDDLMQFAEKLRQRLEAECPAGLRVTASFGVAAALASEGVDLHKLFRQADQACYAAKRAGRNQVVAAVTA